MMTRKRGRKERGKERNFVDDDGERRETGKERRK